MKQQKEGRNMNLGKTWSFMVLVAVGAWMVAVVIGACALAQSLNAQDQPNRPAVFPNTAQPTPLGSTNQTSRTNTNATLPPMYQGGVSNLHDTVGTNAVNHGYANPTLTNRPNPNLQMP
jgi:uncharacterized membrane protein YraQ (UPF0718 family)